MNLLSGRRDFLRYSIAVAAGSTAMGSLGGCSQKVGNVNDSPVSYTPGDPLPWINWAANQHCLPANRLAPTTEDEIVSALKNATGTVRPVGGSHSFSAVVPTDDTLIATDLLSGLVSHDAESQQADFWAGTRIHKIGPLLDAVGQAMPNLPDMDYPSIGGSVATSVHGTGPDFGCIPDYVTALTLATPSGELINCSADENSDVFQAARTSVGALGMVSRVRLQNVQPFQLTEVTETAPVEDILDELDVRFKRHRLFEFFALPYSEMAITVATDLAKEGDANVGKDDPEQLNQLQDAYDALTWLPAVGTALYERALTRELKNAPKTVRTGASYRVLPHDRIIRFREMEYTVPIEFGPACLREILATIRHKKLPLAFPIEYRHVKASDIWLSMFEGRAGASISIHQFGDLDYKAAFAEIEPIFWKYAGRPHWGKLHTLGAKQLAALYPNHWQDFQEVRKSLDPKGKMMNDHLNSLFS